LKSGRYEGNLPLGFEPIVGGYEHQNEPTGLNPQRLPPGHPDAYSCPRETIDALLKTPAMKRHVAEIQHKLDRLGFDSRTKEQVAEEARQREQYRQWALNSTAEAEPTSEK
jgi:hypothetical protein